MEIPLGPRKAKAKPSCGLSPFCITRKPRKLAICGNSAWAASFTIRVESPGRLPRKVRMKVFTSGAESWAKLAMYPVIINLSSRFSGGGGCCIASFAASWSRSASRISSDSAPLGVSMVLDGVLGHPPTISATAKTSVWNRTVPQTKGFDLRSIGAVVLNFFIRIPRMSFRRRRLFHSWKDQSHANLHSDHQQLVRSQQF